MGVKRRRPSIQNGINEPPQVDPVNTWCSSRFGGRRSGSLSFDSAFSNCFDCRESVPSQTVGVLSGTPNSTTATFERGSALVGFRSRFFAWRTALLIVKPETPIGWHRRAFQPFWRWKSRPGRPAAPAFLELTAFRVFGMSGFALFTVPPVELERHRFRPKSTGNLVQDCTLLHAGGIRL